VFSSPAELARSSHAPFGWAAGQALLGEVDSDSLLLDLGGGDQNVVLEEG